MRRGKTMKKEDEETVEGVIVKRKEEKRARKRKEEVGRGRKKGENEWGKRLERRG